MPASAAVNMTLNSVENGTTLAGETTVVELTANYVYPGVNTKLKCVATSGASTGKVIQSPTFAAGTNVGGGNRTRKLTVDNSTNFDCFLIKANGDTSNVINILSWGPPESPSVTATANTDSISVSWTEPQNNGVAIIAYYAHVVLPASNCTDFSGSALDSSARGAVFTSYTDATGTEQPLTGGTAYKVCVQAENDLGVSGAELLTSGTWGATPVITAVSTSESSAAVTFTMNPVPTPDGGATYQYSLDGSTNWTTASATFTGTTGSLTTAGASDFSALKLRVSASGLETKTSDAAGAIAKLAGDLNLSCGTGTSTNRAWSGKWQNGDNASGTATIQNLACNATQGQVTEIVNTMLPIYSSWSNKTSDQYQGSYGTSSSNFTAGDQLTISGTTGKTNIKKGGKASVANGTNNVYVEGTFSSGNWSWIPYASKNNDTVDIKLTRGGVTRTLWTLVVTL